jgi:RNA-directed DNA polymerase
MNTSKKMMYGWDTNQWRKLERNVFKLQKRIYQASLRGDVKTVHKLQRLLIKSKSAALLAVRRVTQTNQGKNTAGIDGVKSMNARQKLKLARKIARNPLIPKAKSVRRVWIPKPGKDEQRPLGIPVMEDRARQALVKIALEPEWEAKFEPHSYGFRPGRSCHDAIEAMFIQLRDIPKYVLDADIAKCFDRINHEALLKKLGTFPNLRRAIRAWLKAGMMDDGELFPTTEGTPQGGVISPLLANIALHGLSTAIECAFQKNKRIPPEGKLVTWRPGVIRYADDFVILHRDLEVLKKARQIAADWLKGMGLELKPSKTRITHALKAVDGPIGFDFLGFHVRQYPRGKNRCMNWASGEYNGIEISIRLRKE